MKTVDKLLSKYSNLQEAVAILIQSAIDNNDKKALTKWDKFRYNETIKEAAEKFLGYQPIKFNNTIEPPRSTKKA